MSYPTGTLHATVPSSQAIYAYWLEHLTVLVKTSCSLVGCEKEFMPGTVDIAICGEVIVPRGRTCYFCFAEQTYQTAFRVFVSIQSSWCCSQIWKEMPLFSVGDGEIHKLITHESDGNK